jgi:hypothetical protein
MSGQPTVPVLPTLRRGVGLDGIRLRIKARLCEAELNEKLARGTDPTESLTLSVRAGQLRSMRKRLARSLRSALEVADRQPSIHQLLRGGEVQSCRASIAELADRLERLEYPSTQALAITHQLLVDRDSSLYWDRAPDSLAATVESALAKFDDD